MYKVVRTKHYSIIQIKNMARNLAAAYNTGISIDRTFVYSRAHPDSPPKITFTIEVEWKKKYHASSFQELQDKYFVLMKEEVK